MRQRSVELKRNRLSFFSFVGWGLALFTAGQARTAASADTAGPEGALGFARMAAPRTWMVARGEDAAGICHMSPRWGRLQGKASYEYTVWPVRNPIAQSGKDRNPGSLSPPSTGEVGHQARAHNRGRKVDIFWNSCLSPGHFIIPRPDNTGLPRYPYHFSAAAT